MYTSRMTTSRPYIGQPFLRSDDLWEIRVRSGSNTVFVSNQGYENYADAMTVLVHLLHGGPHVIRRADGTFHKGTIGAWMRRRTWPRRTRPYTGSWKRRPSDNKWETAVRAQTPGRNIIVTSANQGYNNEADAIAPLERMLLDGPHVVKGSDGAVIPVGAERPTRRGLRKALAGAHPLGA